MFCATDGCDLRTASQVSAAPVSLPRKIPEAAEVPPDVNRLGRPIRETSSVWASPTVASARHQSQSRNPRTETDDLKVWILEALDRQQNAIERMLVSHRDTISSGMNDSFNKVLHDAPFSGLPGSFGSQEQAETVPKREEKKRQKARRTPVPEDNAFEPPIGVGQLNESFGNLNNRGNGSMSSIDSVALSEMGWVTGNLHRLVKSKTFDVTMGMVIVCNMVCMFVQLELQGYKGEVALGHRQVKDGDWHGADLAFSVLDEIFNAVYLTELLLRIRVHRCAYFRDVTNTIDAAVVIFSSFEAYILRPLGPHTSAAGLGATVRVFRVVRVFRIMRFLTQFAELRVLLRSCWESASAFLWSMLLASVVILAAAIFMAQISTEFIMSPDLKPEAREFLYKYYGSASRATLTMFEVTYSGGWTSRARPTIEDVHIFFAVFWFFYIILFHFALTRIMAALFLKQTMQVATMDKDRAMLLQLQTLTTHLRYLFSIADTSGDGLLSLKELETFFEGHEVTKMLRKVDLSTGDIRGLFRILDDGNGQVALEDFLHGAMRLKGAVLPTDAIAIIAESHKIKHGVHTLGQGLVSVCHNLRADVSDIDLETAGLCSR